jgi:hypothetical protein
MLEFLDFQVNVCPGQAGRIKAIEVTGRMTGKPEVIPADPIRAITSCLPTTHPQSPDPLRTGGIRIAIYTICSF